MQRQIHSKALQAILLQLFFSSLEGALKFPCERYANSSDSYLAGLDNVRSY